ncbi:unnamed protein product [Blepharisma stoltei]|uniref:Uncharacterized protein n=1 Tax=Blepharisma stoltei TaxID=1481888 RepID=A0AAU9J146_9CILI|nr:unnamed protein product [Blepharisma stoltei]
MAYSRRLRQHLQQLAMLIILSHLSTSIEIIVAYEDSYGLNYNGWNITSLLEVTQSLSPLVDWHKCSISSLSECVDYYPNSLIILDLSENLDIFLIILMHKTISI